MKRYPSLHKPEVRGGPGRSSSGLSSYPYSRACRGPGCGLSTSATPLAVGYLRCSRPRSASPPKRPPRRSATPAASGRRPNPPVGGSTAAPYWAPAAPYWYWAATAYWSVAAPCAIAGAATSSVRRASIVARYTALFRSPPPSIKPSFPIIKISMRGRRAKKFQGAKMSKKQPPTDSKCIANSSTTVNRSGMRESVTQSYTEARSLWKKFLRVILRRAGTQLLQMCLRKTERKSSIILPVPHQGRKGENGR